MTTPRHREEFPTLASGIHLLSHSLGPVPRAARESMIAYFDAWEHHTSEDAWATSWWELSRRVGDRIARILGGAPGSVQIQPNASTRAIDIVRGSAPFRELRGQGRVRPAGLGDLEPAEWSPPCESGHVRWALDVWYLLTFNGMVGEGRAFLVDLVERQVVRERDFQFRAG